MDMLARPLLEVVVTPKDLLERDEKLTDEEVMENFAIECEAAANMIHVDEYEYLLWVPTLDVFDSVMKNDQKGIPNLLRTFLKKASEHHSDKPEAGFLLVRLEF